MTYEHNAGQTEKKTSTYAHSKRTEGLITQEQIKTAIKKLGNNTSPHDQTASLQSFTNYSKIELQNRYTKQ